MRHDFSIGLTCKDATAGDEHIPERLEILDYAIVNDSDLSSGMGMSIVDGWASMGGPTCMRDSNGSKQRGDLEFIGQIVQFPGGPPPLDRSVTASGNTGGVVPSIF
ncbi:hypothetical protein GGQ90_004902 [Sphingobium scionense]|nr:hypothetical protein [Sphingobium scionense]